MYRFAFLMTGRADTAADVLRHTVVRAARGGLNDIRNPLQAKRWLFAEARTLCAHPPPAAPRGDVPLPPVPSPASADPASAPAALPDLPLDAPGAGDGRVRRCPTIRRANWRCFSPICPKMNVAR